MYVADTTNVRIAGLTFQPHSQKRTEGAQYGDKNMMPDATDTTKDAHMGTLLRFGGSGFVTSYDHGGVLSDVFFRGIYGFAEKMLEINDDFTIVDHSWLWVGDHTYDQQMFGHNGLGYTADNAIVVSGNYASLHGIFAEHTNKDIIDWSGTDGILVFQQTELNYYLNLNSEFLHECDKSVDVSSCESDEISQMTLPNCWGPGAGEFYAGLRVTGANFKSWGKIYEQNFRALKTYYNHTKIDFSSS